ncbi:MAG: anti-sigma F factor [Clostridia bacterium]|nr:anti-sigma F factor [Clostridia bacterium]
MNNGNYFEMKIKAETCNESFIRSTVAAFCVALDPTLEELNDVKTAVSEAITNCVVHAYSRENSGEITVKVSLSGKTAIIEIRDSGCGISDVETAMKPFYTTKPEEERSGMGFTLMQTFMDGVTVKSEVGRGTTVVMEKTFVKNAK